jgi:hypothetical protein
MTPSDRDAVQFTSESAERIANVVRAAELTPTRGRALSFDAIQQGASRKTFRTATFTGAWAISTSKTVTFKNQTTTPNTVSASNLFWPIPEGPQRDCAIAKEGTAWYLLVPQLYAANAATAATITTASLEFKTLPVVALATSSTAVFSVSISTCGTATASP